MNKQLRTTSLIALMVWAAFFLIGIVNHRPFICIISGLFFALSAYRRFKISRYKSPVEKLWDSFADTHPELKEYPYQIWNFYDSKECSGIADKIINRTIRAASYSLDFFDANHEPIPEVGQYNVICCSGEAIGIAKTTAVTEMCFCEYDQAHALTEGYATLEKWKKVKKEMFETQCEKMGFSFSEDMKLIYEEFEIVYCERRKEGIQHA